MAAKAAGKSTVTETEFIEMKKKGAAKEAQDALSSCVDGAGTDAARTACINGPSGSRRGLADSPLTKAIAKALGKKATEVDITEVNIFMKKGAGVGVRNAMEGCYAAASTKADKLACRQGPASGGRRSSQASGPVAVALAKSLGKAQVEKSDVEEYVRASARERTAFTMKSCIDASADTDAARNACRDTTVKTTYMEALGLEASDVKAEAVEEQC